MANTLKFGAGQWATKEGSTLAYNDENDNYKPLPFTFTRASNATVVNKAGLIETVGNAIPRIDFLGNTQGALKLEPQRTNAATYSEAFDNSFWIKDNATVVGGYSAPDGSNNAFKLIEGTSNSQHNVRSSFIPTTNGSEIAASVFVKADTRSEVVMQEAAYTGVYLSVDLISETITTNGTSANLTKLVNGWFRIDIISTCNVVTAWKLMPSLNGTSTYQGDGTSGIYIWGFQLEDVASYATSYIPTSGSSVTRLADNAYKENATQVIGQSEGTMFLEFVPQYVSSTQILYQIRSNIGTVGQVDFRLQSGNIIALGNDGGSTQFFIDGGSYTVGSKYKLAVRYKLNDSKFYINGVEVGNDTSCSFTGSSLNQVSFAENLYSFLPIANIIDARLYNTALTDQELQALTQV
jgi:hypothetical protein